MANSFQEAFLNLRRRNKVLFTLVVAVAIILFWKGVWVLADIVFDEWLFAGHLVWSNLAAAVCGMIVLAGAGVLLEKLS